VANDKGEKSNKTTRLVMFMPTRGHETVCHHDRLYPIRAAAKHRPIHAFASTLIWTRRPPSMLQELSHMDRITQLQDEIQQLLTIMSSTIAYLTSRANFVQVSADVPITKQRNPEKYDTPEMFEGTSVHIFRSLAGVAD
jgi:hypothetical protein